MATNVRKITVQSPLGQDTLLFRRMTGQEALGGLFKFKVLLLSEKTPIDADKVLGQPMTICMDLPAGGQRFFNGIVTAFGQTGTYGRYAAYQAVLQPKLWLLSQRTNCRVFQDQKASKIIEQVLKDGGCTDVKASLSASYSQREYCVQYRETDLAFITRLMEEEGIYYYFTHTKDKHTLVLADSINAHGTVSGYDKVPCFPPDERAARTRDHFDHWSTQHSSQASSVALKSYFFEQPSTDLTAQMSSKAEGYKDTSLKRFDYPDDYTQTKVGQHAAQVRQEHLDSLRGRSLGDGNARGLFPGCLFTLEAHPQADLNREYLLVSSVYQLRSNEYESGGSDGDGDGDFFQTRVQALDSHTPFRLAAETPRPVVHGPQSAAVTGDDSGGNAGDVWTDKYGRIKVQFFWDRKEQAGDHGSCWLRVAQSWAGPGRGTQFIPRVGDEVLVAFLGGDADRPIVVGSLYNASNMPPCELPGNATQSGIKTHTVKGGADNFNELRFEDKQGSEQVYLQAEKDFVQLVKNGDYGTTLEKGNQTVTLKEGDQTTTLEKGNQVVNLKQGDQTTTLGKGSQTVTLDAGNFTTTLSKGKAVIEAKQSIELKVGQSSVLIGPSGITLKGPMIKLQGQNAVQVKGSIAQIEGSGTVKIKGGLVGIN